MRRFDELKKLFSYAATGGAAAVADFSAFVALYHLTGSRFGAAALSFLIAAIVNYTMSSILVFRHSLSYRQFFLFIGFASVGFAINVSVTITASTLMRLDPAAGKVCGIAVAFVFNYLLNRLFVFARAPVCDARPSIQHSSP